MKMLRAICFCLAALLLEVPCHANPISARDGEDIEQLPQRVADGGTNAERERWSDLLSRYGFDLFRAKSLRYVTRHLRQLTPLLIASQEPNRGLSLNVYSLHRVFRCSATPEDKEEMVRTLRRWLVEPLPRVEVRFCGVRGADTTAWNRYVVLRTRAIAAEILSDYRDQDAAPLILALERSLEAEPNRYEVILFRPFIHRALERLINPHATGILARLCDAKVEGYAAPGTARAVTVHRSRRDPHPAITSESTTCSALVQALESAQSPLLDEGWRVSRGWRGLSQEFTIGITFANGDSASLTPVGRRGFLRTSRAVLYSDNTRLEFLDNGNRYILESRDLIHQVDLLIHDLAP